MATDMRQYLFVDTAALESLAGLAECSLGPRDVEIPGFESYIVEQWACQRRVSIVISSFTGNPEDVVLASSLLVPESKQDWSPALLDFMEQLSRMHMLPMETKQGIMFVSNLSSFPSNNTLISLQRSFSQGLELFYVNEDLKRLKCMGRLAVRCAAPTDASMAAFYKSFKVSSQVPPQFAVVELITLVQIGLYYTDLLPGEFVDGLCCDYTTKAIEQWWQKFGRVIHGDKQPQPVSATSLAGIIGFVMGIRDRLSLLGYRIPKDPFAVQAFMHCIYQFQKGEKLEKTRKLNEPTARRLFEVTARHTTRAPDLYKSLKSSMKESLSGKERNTIEDIETCDITVLAAHVRGQRAKYLWKNAGNRFVPLGTKGLDPQTGIPKKSIVEDIENKGRLLSSRQKQNFNLLKRTKAPTRPGISETGERHERSHSDVQLQNESLHTSNASDEDVKELPVRVERVESIQSKRKPISCTKITDASLLTRDDLQASQHRRPPLLRRTRSLSAVSSTIFTWSFPASLARIGSMYDNAVQLRELFVRQLEDSTETCDELRKQLSVQGTNFTNENRQGDVVKFQIVSTTRKEHGVKLQIHDLEATTAKIDYQWALLVSQIEEVEKTIHLFGRRVDALEERWTKHKTKNSTTLWQRATDMADLVHKKVADWIATDLNKHN